MLDTDSREFPSRDHDLLGAVSGPGRLHHDQAAWLGGAVVLPLVAVLVRQLQEAGGSIKGPTSLEVIYHARPRREQPMAGDEVRIRPGLPLACFFTP